MCKKKIVEHVLSIILPKSSGSSVLGYCHCKNLTNYILTWIWLNLRFYLLMAFFICFIQDVLVLIVRVGAVQLFALSSSYQTKTIVIYLVTLHSLWGEAQFRGLHVEVLLKCPYLFYNWVFCLDHIVCIRISCW